MKKLIVVFIIMLLAFYGCDTNKSINIGAVQQLTGQMSKYGKTQVAAVNAMKDVINSEREKNGLPPVNIFVEDDKLQPQEGN